MGSARIDVEGEKELRAALKRANAELAPRVLKELHLSGAEVVEKHAKSRTVPVLTGALQGTIRAAGQQSRAVVRAGKASVPYAGVIHFGWPGHNIEPNPYLYDAVDQRAQDVIRVYQKKVDEIVAKVGRSTP